MARNAHLVGRLDVEAVVCDLEAAMALRPRIEALCWHLMPQLLERVCDALAPKGVHVQIDRLDLDLGILRPDHLEEDALAALEAALFEALSGALFSARQLPSDKARLIAPPVARLRQFEAYLTNGVLPFSNRADPFDPRERLLELAREQPDALIAALRRQAQDDRALERLVHQLGDEGLERLLALLAPADAARILGLLTDILLVHRTARPPALDRVTEPALHRLVWVTSLEFLLRDAGSQFNRRRFLRFLLEREARHAGISYAALLPMLAAAAEKAAQRSALRSSLPRTLVELLEETRRVEVEWMPSAAPPIGAEPGAEPPPPEAGVEALVRFLARRAATDSAGLEALFGHARRTVLDALIRRLEPAQAASILADLDALAAFHAVFPLLPRNGDGFDRLIRAMALAHLAQPGRSAFHRRAFWDAVVAGIARHGDRSPSELANLIRRGLDAHGPHPRLSGLVTALAGAAERPSGRGQPAGEATKTGEADALLDAIRSGTVDPHGIGLLVGAAPPERLRDLIGRLRPADAGTILAGLDALTASRARSGPAPFDRDRAERLVLTLTLVRLAELGDATFDPGAWSRHLDAELARRGGAASAGSVPDGPPAPGIPSLPAPLPAADALRATLAPLLAGLPGTAAVDRDGREALRRLIEGYLRSGRPRSAAVALEDAARREPEWLADRIREVARDAPDDATALAGRLLDGLLPQEVLDLLLPGQATALLRRVSDTPGGDLPLVVPMIAALLRGDRPAGDARAQGADPQGPGPRLDRDALIAHWLTHGTLAAWAPVGLTAAALLADLPDRSLAELAALFLAEDGERTAGRLSRAATVLGHGEASRLLGRIAPPAADPDRPADGFQRRLRAAARALAGDMAGETADERPIPPARSAEQSGSEPSVLQEDFRHPREGRDDDPAWKGASSPHAIALARSGHERSGHDDGSRRQDSPPSADELFAWLEGTGAGPADPVDFARQFAALADRNDPALRDYLAAHRGRAAARARWAAILPPEALGRLVDLLVPAGSRGLVDSVMLIGTAWRHTAPFGARRPAPQALWSCLLEQIATPHPVDLARVLDGLMESLTGQDAAQRARLAARARHLAQDGGYVTIGTALRRVDAGMADPQPDAAAPPQPARPAAAPPRRPAGDPRSGVPVTAPRSGRPPEDGQAPRRVSAGPDHPIFIGNAGLVLLNPYLPMFFERLGVLPPEDGRAPRRDGIEAVSRAAHLLQYLADGRLDAPEPELVLNKLLCGQPSACPVARSHAADPEELALCDGLLTALIANWPALRNTSPDGLRETFLRREGRLRRADGKWLLQVQRKTLDVLTDQAPWSFAIVYHRWMKEPIHVTW